MKMFPKIDRVSHNASDEETSIRDAQKIQANEACANPWV